MKRVKRPHGLLPKAPEKGDKIVVVVDGMVMRAYVRRSTGGRKIKHRTAGTFPVELTERVPHKSRGGSVYRRDEGTTWVRGWDTPAARALAVATALS